ncbi:hypothetical protein G4V62_14975 [Bacillaceae bacterium SIJ1]|uniref:hypothetical protein n=1 Tax=Litoribacterium kuwaitense TaxID=1398745 RepID=UPI0013E9B3D7|nr:hypothetical protein [Litoribacterium kuwaitense]NGP46189.1 hypothetical protein [Litoribacterium kuwaitense]
MSVNKISLMDAYMIESLRRKEITDDEIIEKATAGDVSSWEVLQPHYDFTELSKLAKQNKDAFHSIIQDGYQIKFVTIYGIQSLLKMKFNILKDDYVTVENGITQLKVTEDQYLVLKQMLSTNWTMTETSSDGPNKVISILM